MALEQQKSYILFSSSIRSDETRKTYILLLKKFIEFLDETDIRYCRHCLDYGFSSVLKNRVYPEGEPIPSDHENYLQCHECGSIVPVHETEKEATLKDIVSTTDNPFDAGKSFLGIDSRKLRKKRKQKDSFDYIEDDDVKRELKKGHTVLSYSEEMPQ